MKRFATAAMALALSGCSAQSNPPSIPLFGSFFPAWIICAIGGVVMALVLRAVFIALGLDQYLPMPPVVYLCLAISGGIGLWFLWSGIV